MTIGEIPQFCVIQFGSSVFGFFPPLSISGPMEGVLNINPRGIWMVWRGERPRSASPEFQALLAGRVDLHDPHVQVFLEHLHMVPAHFSPTEPHLDFEVAGYLEHGSLEFPYVDAAFAITRDFYQILGIEPCPTQAMTLFSSAMYYHFFVVQKYRPSR